MRGLAKHLSYHDDTRYILTWDGMGWLVWCGMVRYDTSQNNTTRVKSIAMYSEYNLSCLAYTNSLLIDYYYK